MTCRRDIFLCVKILIFQNQLHGERIECLRFNYVYGVKRTFEIEFRESVAKKDKFNRKMNPIVFSKS